MIHHCISWQLDRDGGLTTAVVTRWGRRQLDSGVGGNSSVITARRQQWRRLEGDNGGGKDSTKAAATTW